MRRWLLADAGGKVPRENLTLLLSPLDRDGAPLVNAPLPEHEEATKEHIADAARMLLQRSDREQGRLFVFFSGHGILARDHLSDVRAIAACDFTADWTSRAITVPSVLDAFAGSALLEQFFFFDACANSMFDPPFATSSLLDRRPGHDALNRPNQYACFATAPGRVAYEEWSTGAEEGLFSSAVLRGLRGEGRAKRWDRKAREYVVRFDDLFGFIAEDVAGRTVGTEPVQKPWRLVDAGPENPVLVRFLDGHFENVVLDVTVAPADAAQDLTVWVSAEARGGETLSPPVQSPTRLPLPPRSYTVYAESPRFAPFEDYLDLYQPDAITVELREGTAPKVTGEGRAVRGGRPAETRPTLAASAADRLATVEAVDDGGDRAYGVGVLEIAVPGRYRLALRGPEDLGPIVAVELRQHSLVVTLGPPRMSPEAARLASIIGAGWNTDGTIALADAIPAVAGPTPSTIVALAACASVLRAPWGDGLRGLGFEALSGELRERNGGVLVAVVTPVADPERPLTAALNTGDARSLHREVVGGPGATALEAPAGSTVLTLGGLGAGTLSLPVYCEEGGVTTVIVDLSPAGAFTVSQLQIPVGLAQDSAHQAVRAEDLAQRFAGVAGRLEQARDLLQRSGPGALSAVLAGLVRFRLGDEPSVLDKLAQQLVAEHPMLPDAAFLYAAILAVEGHRPEAIEAARQGAAVGPAVFRDAAALASRVFGDDPPPNSEPVGRRKVPYQLFNVWA